MEKFTSFVGFQIDFGLNISCWYLAWLLYERFEWFLQPKLHLWDKGLFLDCCLNILISLVYSVKIIGLKIRLNRWPFWFGPPFWVGDLLNWPCIVKIDDRTSKLSEPTDFWWTERFIASLCLFVCFPLDRDIVRW